jgi:hypothetical protein
MNKIGRKGKKAAAPSAGATGTKGPATGLEDYKPSK